MELRQFSSTSISPISQASSSDPSESNLYEDLMCPSPTAHNKNHIVSKSVINSKENNIKRKPIKNNKHTKKQNNKHHNDVPSDEYDEENIEKILAQHPCTPRPRTLSYNAPIKHSTTKKKTRNMRKVRKVSNNTFSKTTLKPITTPRPESPGIDSTDSEEDDDDVHDHIIPDEDDIMATDDYHIKKKEKWRETQKGPSYHAYTAEDDENKQDKPTNTKYKSVRGAEYFPKNELDGRYEFVQYLGHGAYGYVAEGRHIKTGRKVAIKKILRIFHNRIDAKRLLRELKILRVLRGLESIVQLIDILPPRNFETFNQIILVFEYIDTDMSKLIQSDQYFTQLHVQYMLYQVLLGLKFMHSLKIYHRDLKPANILVNEDVSLKICDFGLARCTYNNHQFESVESKHKSVISSAVSKKSHSVKRISNGHRRNNVTKRLTQHVVTRWYRAPEVILLQQKREYLGAVDMWSVGCIFGELLQMLRENLRSHQHRKPIFPGQSSIPLSPPSDPFPSMDQLTVIFGIIGTPTPEEILNIDNERAARFLLQIPKCLPSPLKNMYPGADEQALSLLRGLLQFDVVKRITVEEALSHPFIQTVRDEKNEKKYEKMINNIKSAHVLNFEFEDIKMKMDTYRSLIIEEVLRYNPHLLRHHKSSSASSFDFV